ncbi:MAG: Mpv17/PMP22 family protein [Firmicutes bacterium]|nr:Mpv17/PMP22 family protein [Bacillota bacterium]
MRKGDFIWGLLLLLFGFILIFPATHNVFISLTTNHPYLMGFVKLSILATMGELLAIRIGAGKWKKPSGIVYRAIIWGFFGMVFAIMFPLFAGGVNASIDAGLLPGKNSNLLFAFFTSALMNLTFAPTFMGFHRITDAYIDLSDKENSNVTLKKALNNIDWEGFVSFVVIKTIPLFWIPAHTVTFLLPPEYRVLMAAFLSIALGAILASASKKKVNNA